MSFGFSLSGTPGAVVRNDDLPGFAVPAERFDHDTAAGRHVLQGVVDQIAHRLCQENCVPRTRDGTTAPEEQSDALLFCRREIELSGVSRNPSRVE